MVQYIHEIIKKSGIPNPKPQYAFLYYIYTLDAIRGKYFVFVIDPESIKQHLAESEEFLYWMYYISVFPGRNVYDIRPDDVSLLAIEYGVEKRRTVFEKDVAYWRNNVS